MRLLHQCITTAVFAACCVSSVWADGSGNLADKAWQVRYHKDNANKRGDVAVRLKIAEGTGLQLTGSITRFHSVAGSKYKPSNSGKVALTGKIIKNGGGGNQRKREEFILAGTYFDELVPRVVIIRGYYSTGRNKDAGNRADDFVVVRIRDKAVGGTLIAASSVIAPEPCDDEPPDEDILTEEDAPGADPPDPDYDAGP